MPVESGRDEHPDLVKDDWRSNKEADDEADFQVVVEWVRRTEVSELRVPIMSFEGLLDRHHHLFIDGCGVIPTNSKAHGHGANAVDEPLAQLLNVLQQAHGAHLPFFFVQLRLYYRIR